MSDRFCPRCGNVLAGRPLACRGCGQVHYVDPKLAACAIFDWQDGVFLLRRSIDPGRGRWTFPGGYVDRGETVEAAAVREAAEEAGVRVRLDDLLGIYSYEAQTTVVMVYTASVIDGVPHARSESLEGASFHAEAIPWRELAFPSTREALHDYLAAREPGGRLGLSRNLVRPRPTAGRDAR